MAIEEVLNSVQQFSAKELETLLLKRRAEDKAIGSLWRAALAREREQRRQARGVQCAN